MFLIIACFICNISLSLRALYAGAASRMNTARGKIKALVRSYQSRWQAACRTPCLYIFYVHVKHYYEGRFAYNALHKKDAFAFMNILLRI